MAEKISIQNSYSALNEKLAKQFDEAGVRRTFTVPYVEGQSMSDHIDAVTQAADQNGGLTGNMITSAHRAGGKGWHSAEGETVGHPADKLRQTIISKDNEHAKASIEAAQKHLNNLGSLIGKDDPDVVTANSQLDLVKKADGAGMNLFDFGGMLTQIMYKPMQAMARAHSGTKDGGHAPQLRAPEADEAPEGQESAPEAQGEAQGGGDTSEGTPEASAAPAAPAAPAGTPAAPPAA
jgi:hypothetical protein